MQVLLIIKCIKLKKKQIWKLKDGKRPKKIQNGGQKFKSSK